MFKLSRRVNEGPSAVELIEASKKLYVKTEALKQTKIDVCGPRLFHKTASEEELAMLYQNFAYNPVPHQLPAPRRANVVKISPPSFPTHRQRDALQMCESRPTSKEEGVAFCITSSTLSPSPPAKPSSNWYSNEESQKYNYMHHQKSSYSENRSKDGEAFDLLKNGLSSAFQPVMVTKKTPPTTTGPTAVFSSGLLTRSSTAPPPIPPKSKELRKKMSQRRIFPRTSPMHTPPLHPQRQKTFNGFDAIGPEASVNTTIELHSLDATRQETTNVIVRMLEEEEKREKRPVPPPRQSLRQRPVPPPRFLRRRQTTSDIDTAHSATAFTAAMSRSMHNPKVDNMCDENNRDPTDSLQCSNRYSSTNNILRWQSFQDESIVQQNLPSLANPSSSYNKSTSDLNTAIHHLRMAVASANGTLLNHPASLNEQLEVAIAKRLAEINEKKEEDNQPAKSTLISGNRSNPMSMSCYGQLPFVSSSKFTKFDTQPNKPPRSENGGPKNQVTTFPAHPIGECSPDSMSSSSTIVNASSNALNINSINSSPTAYSSSRDSGHVSENGMSSGLSNAGSSLLSTSAYGTQGHAHQSLRKLKSRQLSPIGSALPPVMGKLDSGGDFEERVQRWERRNKESKSNPRMHSSSIISSQDHPSTSSSLTVTVFKDLSGPSSNGQASVSLYSSNPHSHQKNKSTSPPVRPNKKDLQAIVSSSISSVDSKGLNEETLQLMVELDRCQIIHHNPQPEEAEEASALFFSEPTVNLNEENDCSSSLVASSSIFTSISAVQSAAQPNGNAGSDEGATLCNGILKESQEMVPKPAVVNKPVSQIEKTARVIQWIHGCSTDSNKKFSVATTTTMC